MEYVDDVTLSGVVYKAELMSTPQSDLDTITACSDENKMNPNPRSVKKPPFDFKSSTGHCASDKQCTFP